MRVETKNPIPEVKKEGPEIKEELEINKKSVRFLPYVHQRKYDRDSKLQKLEEEKDELRPPHFS